MPVAIEEERSVYKGEQRDILQLTVLLPDGMAVQEIIRGLRGRDRELIEDVLGRLVVDKGGQRDILQVTEKSEELSPDLYRALNHLIGSRSPYLGSLVKLAKYKYDWRKLLLPSSF